MLLERTAFLGEPYSGDNWGTTGELAPALDRLKSLVPEDMPRVVTDLVCEGLDILGESFGILLRKRVNWRALLDRVGAKEKVIENRVVASDELDASFRSLRLRAAKAFVVQRMIVYLKQPEVLGITFEFPSLPSPAS